MMLPHKFIENMTLLPGLDGEAFFAALQEAALPTALRINPLRSEVVLPWELMPVPWCPTGYYVPEGVRPGAHPLHDAGAYYMQEASAMAVGEALAIEPGMKVLDLCAAPGGKSGHIGGKLKHTGLLVSNEVMPDRARLLSSQLERLGLREICVTNEHPDRLANHFGAVFDRVLVDAPCSGEGMFRKDPSSVSGWSPKLNESCAHRQRLILDSAARMVRPGGRLIYSTCTFSPLENEENARWFLKEHADFLPLPIEIPKWQKGLMGEEYCARLWPHLDAGEGHFIAAFMRVAGEESDWPVARSAPRSRAADDFWLQNMKGEPPSQIVEQGDMLWALPMTLPDLGKLRIIRAGVPLGRLAKGYFHPHHSLAMAYPARQTLGLTGEKTLLSYLAGNEIPAEGNGWQVVTVGHCPLGWGKASQGRLKNHLPTGLRRIGRNEGGNTHE